MSTNAVSLRTAFVAHDRLEYLDRLGTDADFLYAEASPRLRELLAEVASWSIDPPTPAALTHNLARLSASIELEARAMAARKYREPSNA
jgi:hypothetical protein